MSKFTHCAGCSYPSAKPDKHNILVCTACFVEEEDSADGKSVLVYVRTVDKKEKKDRTLVMILRK
jgi:hypothetical protein